MKAIAWCTKSAGKPCDLKNAVAEPAGNGPGPARGRIRGAGAGRKKLITKDENLLSFQTLWDDIILSDADLVQ